MRPHGPARRRCFDRAATRRWCASPQATRATRRRRSRSRSARTGATASSIRTSACTRSPSAPAHRLRRRRAHRRHRLPQLRQPREAGDRGSSGAACAASATPAARWDAGRVRQRLALQRDRGPGHPAHADDRHGRPRPGRREDLHERVKHAGDVIALVGTIQGEVGGPSTSPPSTATRPAARRRSTSRRRRPCRRRCAAPSVRGCSSAHDCSDGGLAVALAECCMMHGAPAGATETPGSGAAVRILFPTRKDFVLFGRTRSRSSCRCRRERGSVRRARPGGAPVIRLGAVGGDTLEIQGALSVPVAELAKAWRDGIPAALWRDAGTPPPRSSRASRRSRSRSAPGHALGYPADPRGAGPRPGHRRIRGDVTRRPLHERPAARPCARMSTA